jgi:polar amino acid transport system substrate-binding protein
MLHRRVVLLTIAALFCAGSALAQSKKPPLRTGVDGTFAPHAMPKLGGGIEGFQIDLFTEVAKGSRSICSPRSQSGWGARSASTA